MIDLDALEALWRDQRYSQTHKLLDALPELIRLARIGQQAEPPYERGHLDGQIAMRERAAKVCEQRALELYDAYKRGNGPNRANPHTEGMADAYDGAAQRILSLQPEGADQREAAAKGHANAEASVLSTPAQAASHPNPGEQVVRDAHTEDGSKHCVEPARPGPSQECVSVPVSTVEWLCGERAHPRTGLWFEMPQGAGTYWWRSVLREDIAATRKDPSNG